MFCKNCRFWLPYIDNNMLHPPGNKPRACTLRIHVETDEEGNETAYPSIMPKDEPGPDYGRRTEAKHGCGYIVVKHKPTVNLKRREKKSWKTKSRAKVRFTRPPAIPTS